VLEFRSAQSTVIHCFAEPDVLDAMHAPDGAMTFRIAGRELICMASGREGAAIMAALSAAIKNVDPNALLLDRSDGWSVFALSGEDCAKAFGRLCTTPLPQAPGFFQGAIGTVPAKAVVLEDRIYLIVSSILGHHIRERILEACADISPLELPEGCFVGADTQEMA
jgi:hypothetical protein